MQNIGDIVAIVLMASFLLHFVGLIPLITLLAIFGYDKIDNFYIVKKVDKIKSDDLRQLVYFPLLSILGALFMGLLILYANFCRTHPPLQNTVLGLSILGYLFLIGRKNYLQRHPKITL
jgi:hypothetical protein